MTTKAKTGRPPHKPTAAMRRRVSIAAGAGMPHDDIALAIGISTPTLCKWYASELSTEAHKRRMENFESLFSAAMKGNVSAMKAYAAASPQAAAPDPEPAGAGEKLGKKAQASADAKTAHVDTEWSDLLGRAAAPGVQ